MKKLLLSLLVGPLLLASITAAYASSPASIKADAAKTRFPYMSSRDAKYYTRTAMRRKFGASFTYGDDVKISCGRKLSRKARRCEPVSWFIGDTTYKGWTRFVYFKRNGRTYYDQAYKIKRTDTYCVYTGGSNCRKTFRER